jgi:hypothetical protein
MGELNTLDESTIVGIISLSLATIIVAKEMASEKDPPRQSECERTEISHHAGIR